MSLHLHRLLHPSVKFFTLSMRTAAFPDYMKGILIVIIFTSVTKRKQNVKIDF